MRFVSTSSQFNGSQEMLCLPNLLCLFSLSFPNCIWDHHYIMGFGSQSLFWHMAAVVFSDLVLLNGKHCQALDLTCTCQWHRMACDGQEHLDATRASFFKYQWWDAKNIKLCQVQMEAGWFGQAPLAV